MDELYIEKVLNGDTNAFRYFVQQYKDMAFTIAMSVLKSEFDAKDAVQEGFMIAYKNLKAFKGDSKFSSWFYRIVINVSLKQQKKKKQDEHYQITQDDEISIIELSNSNALAIIVEDQQSYFINEAFKNVPPNEALVLTLYYLEEKSIAEVSEMTGWTMSNVKVILFRGRKSMNIELSNILKQEINNLY